MGERNAHPAGEGRGDAGEGDLKPRFRLGFIVGTPAALAALEEAGQEPVELLVRHVTGDWGELPEEDKAENERSVRGGLRILSAYTLSTGVRVWVITEWDVRHVTI